MNIRKIGVVLLVLLLAGMAMVPMVSAEEKNVPLDLTSTIEKNYIPEKTAYLAATAAMQELTGSGALDNTWSGAQVNSRPHIVYDLNGKRLFYLFTVENKGKQIGEIKAAASDVIGASIITIGSGAPPINMEKVRSRAMEIISQNRNSAVVRSLDLVCYNYPEIGVLVRYSVKGGSEETLVLDAYDLSVVPASRMDSYYENILPTEIKTRVTQATYERDALLARGTTISPKATVTKTLNGFPLYPQQGSAWCAFATAQMISGYYGYSRTQTGIADTMGVNPNNGATIEQTRSNYYQVSTANGGLGKSGSFIRYTGQFTYTDIVNELGSNRPLHTDRYESTSYHARAIAGYSYSGTSEYLYIYDPWPVNQGSLYWENWNAFTGQPKPAHAILYVRN
jgi:hypothetical protein